MSITKLIAKIAANYDNPNSVGSKLRTKRATPLLTMIERHFEKSGCVNIIDIGGTEKYWNIISDAFLDNHNVKITIVNLPGLKAPLDTSRFNFIEGDGCALTQINDKSFHIAHSNSVIEHVGNWDRMVSFSKEISRVASSYFVQTPNYWFPMEPHLMIPFFQWLPKPLQIFLVMKINLGHSSKAESVDKAVRIIESVSLLNKKMFSELFKDAEVKYEFFFLLKKSFIAIRK